MLPCALWLLATNCSSCRADKTLWHTQRSLLGGDWHAIVIHLGCDCQNNPKHLSRKTLRHAMQDMILLAAFVQGMLSTALQFSAMRQSCTAQHGTTQQSTSRHSTAQTRHNSTTWCCSHAKAICPGVTPFLSASFLTLSTSFMFCTTLKVTTAAHPGTGHTWCKLQANACMSMFTVRQHMQSKCSLLSVMLLGCGQEHLTIQVKAVAAAAAVIGRNDAQCRGMHQHTAQDHAADTFKA